MNPEEHKELLEIKETLLGYLSGKCDYLKVSGYGAYYITKSNVPTRILAGFDVGELVDIDYYDANDKQYAKELVRKWIDDINRILKKDPVDFGGTSVPP